MRMAQEETIVNLEKLIALFHTASEQSKMVDYSKIIETLEFAAAALSTLRAENEKLRAELERVKRERDAAIKDIWAAKWVSCKHGEGCDYISAITGFPDCAGCVNWEWRGIKED